MEIKIVTPDKEIHLMCMRCGGDLEVIEEDREMIMGDSFQIIHVEPCEECLKRPAL